MTSTDTERHVSSWCGLGGDDCADGPDARCDVHALLTFTRGLLASEAILQQVNQQMAEERVELLLALEEVAEMASLSSWTPTERLKGISARVQSVRPSKEHRRA